MSQDEELQKYSKNEEESYKQGITVAVSYQPHQQQPNTEASKSEKEGEKKEEAKKKNNNNSNNKEKKNTNNKSSSSNTASCTQKLKSKFKQLSDWWDKIPPVNKLATFLAAQMLPLAISVSLTQTTSADWQSHSNEIQRLGDNYNSNFYLDFSLKQSCGLGETNILDYTWPGLNQGCDCYSTTGVINNNFSSCQCTQVPTWKSVNFQYLFSNSGNKQTLCAKRSSLNFFEMGPISLGICSTVQKTCGNTSKPETVLCVSLNDPCPIYDIIFATSVQPQASDPNWGQIQVSSNLYIYYDKQGASATTLPLSQFAFTAGAGVCLGDSSQQNIDLIRKDYPLLAQQRNTCSNIDARFSSVFSIGVNSLFGIEFNSSDFSTLSSMSGLQLSTSTETYSLYKRPYEPWYISDRYRILIFQSIIDDVTFEEFLFSVSFIINTAAASVCYIFGMIYSSVQHGNYMKNDKYKIALWNAFNTIVGLLSKLLQFIMTVVTLAFALDYAFKFTILINDHPSSDVFQSQCQSQLDYIKSIFKTNYIVTIIIQGLFLLKEIICIIPDIYTAYKERKKQLQQQKVSSEKAEEDKSEKDSDEKKEKDDSKSNKNSKNKDSKAGSQNLKSKQYEEWKKQQLKEYEDWYKLVEKQKEETLKLSTKQQEEWQKLQTKIQDEQKQLKSKQIDETQSLKQKQTDEEKKFQAKTEEERQLLLIKHSEEQQNLQARQYDELQKQNTRQSEEQQKMFKKQSEEQQQLEKKQHEEQEKMLKAQKDEQQKLFHKQQEETKKEENSQKSIKDNQKTKQQSEPQDHQGEEDTSNKLLSSQQQQIKLQGSIELKPIVHTLYSQF